MERIDIKNKIKSFIAGKRDSIHSPSEENISHDLFTGEPAVAKYKQTWRPSNPHEDQEILESIEDTYYNNGLQDTSEYELLKLPEVLELEKIDDDRTRLRKQLQVVSKKVSDLVLQNHPAYAAELQRVMELQKTLQLARVICSNGRRQLGVAEQSFTTASLKMLANYRKRQQLIGLLKSLRTIKTLQQTDVRLREMMVEEDYCGAIQLCLECMKAASTYKHYKCISELSSKLQDTLEMIEEQLDVALSKTCSNFEVAHYEKVQTAYRLLGKTQTAMDQLHMHFASAIHNTAFQIVLGYVELYSGTGNSNFHKLQYSDLCRNVNQESFMPCLFDLNRALWEVMKSYHKTIRWHESHELDSSPESGTNVEANFNKQYVKQKLEHGQTRIWQDVQTKVKSFVLGTDLSAFKFEEFIRVLDLVNRLIEIGEEFCGSKSEGLQDSLKQQSLNYFKNHHHYRMDELRMFLENEGWEICPVKSNFNFLQLLEFRFMRSWFKGRDPQSEVGSINSMENMVASGSDKKIQYFEDFKEGTSPFDIEQYDDENEDVFSGSWENEENNDEDSDSDSDIPDELKQDFIDEGTGEVKTSRQIRRRISRNKSQKYIPIITNTTLNVLRVIGKYMQMMTVLKPIAFDVTVCLSQLFDYYLYTVFMFFGSNSLVMHEKSINNRLPMCLSRIRSNLIAESPVPGAPPTELEDTRDKVPQAFLSPIVDLMNGDRLYGLAERIVAVESLVFLSSQLEMIHPHLESMIPPNKKAFLQQFFSHTVKMATELRKPVYWTVSSQVIDYNQVLQQMTTVKWDVRDIMSQHNPYVDLLLKDFELINSRLMELNRRVPVPKVVYDTLWEHTIRLSNRVFVDGFAGAKKCSNEGRALMQLDFQQFLSKVEKVVDIKPLPEREFVEAYIKAYYLPESQFETWLHEHKEYSNKHLFALITSVDHLSKKARQRLMGMVEDMDNNRR
ncbi:hypothetical protein KUTeg_022985 [Tegillarca granosa]|uniref:Syndetin n=1 Tax=Tegillarca granosa TaxID=220873 RepID=A0ABQ9E1B6_TEGGR|nr:hypothetical protein KUTeg_022985 [Tegillarca granosa]